MTKTNAAKTNSLFLLALSFNTYATERLKRRQVGMCPSQPRTITERATDVWSFQHLVVLAQSTLTQLTSVKATYHTSHSSLWSAPCSRPASCPFVNQFVSLFSSLAQFLLLKIVPPLATAQVLLVGKHCFRGSHYCRSLCEATCFCSVTRGLATSAPRTAPYNLYRPKRATTATASVQQLNTDQRKIQSVSALAPISVSKAHTVRDRSTQEDRKSNPLTLKTLNSRHRFMLFKSRALLFMLLKG